MQPVNISTTNLQTFSELVFQFKLAPKIDRQTRAFERPRCAAAAWCLIVHSSPTPAPYDQRRAVTVCAADSLWRLRQMRVLQNCQDGA